MQIKIFWNEIASLPNMTTMKYEIFHFKTYK